jgi:uncharacterized protein (TIGR02466 family)
MNVVQNDHFAVPVFTGSLSMEQIAGDVPSVLQYVLSLETAMPGLQRSNRGGWHSDNNLHRAPNDATRRIFDALHAFTKRALYSYARRDVPVQITMAWANVNRAGDWNEPHTHLPDEWAGVVYLAIPPPAVGGQREGELLLMNPLPLGGQWGRETAVKYQPRVGGLVLFPSFLAHMAAPHRHPNEARVSIAFNARVTG